MNSSVMNDSVTKMNSLINLPMNSVKNAAKPITSMFNSNAARSNTGSSGATSWNTPLMWFLGIFAIGFIIFAYYYQYFVNGIESLTDQLNSWLTGNGGPPEEEQENIPTAPPIPPQDEVMKENTGIEKVVDKILPPAKDVFTISKNNYSYYDAAPLCKALGAELATYEQVKQAWNRGADWCNYGWVKGQMAVYPTQKSSYEELQEGPEDQKGACGKPGVNGGHFDNPELKFGVTCVGKRPPQSQHDANAIAAGSTRPLTVSGLEFEKKVQRFKEESETLGILPFNKEHWDS
jgi:hypothetical protein